MKNDWHAHVLNTLRGLMQQITDDGWVTTRQMSDALDNSIYRARAQLIELRNDGLVVSMQKGRGRQNALLWKALS